MCSNEPMYTKDDDGSYTLNFPNKQALTIEKIEEIFSQFGEVLSVRCAGDDRGFRFVRFSREENAQSAVSGLADSRLIKLVPRRPKQKQQKNQNNDNKNRNGNQKPNNTQKSFSRKNNSNQSNSQSPKDEIQNENDFGISKVDKKPFRNGFFKSGSNSPRGSDKINTFDQNIEKQSTSFSEGITVTEAKELNVQKLQKLHQMRGIIANTFSPNSNLMESEDPKEESLPSLVALKKPAMTNQILGNHFGISRCSQVIDAETHLGDNEEDMPSLIPVESSIKTVKILQDIQNKKQNIVSAEEVIVANIPPDFGAPYILHLFEKYEPISITIAKGIPHLGIRYCRVYFKSTKDAIAVQQEFDKHNLSGTELIVLHISKLLEEGELL